MGKSILITGGVRSGKSRLAERMTLALGSPAIYIATAEAHDAEMTERIARHRARRGPEWHTISEPTKLVQALQDSDGDAPRLVDCLTLWLSNLMLADRPIEAEMSSLTQAMDRFDGTIILVANEVGWGIVPDNALARRFRDHAGRLNQAMATICDEVTLIVAGLPLCLK